MNAKVNGLCSQKSKGTRSKINKKINNKGGKKEKQNTLVDIRPSRAIPLKVKLTSKIAARPGTWYLENRIGTPNRKDATLHVVF